MENKWREPNCDITDTQTHSENQSSAKSDSNYVLGLSPLGCVGLSLTPTGIAPTTSRSYKLKKKEVWDLTIGRHRVSYTGWIESSVAALAFSL